MTSAPTPPPAGWYVNGKTQRYWDGSEWTDQIAPAATPLQQVNIRQRDVSLREAIGIIVLVALVAFVAIAFIAGNS